MVSLSHEVGHAFGKTGGRVSARELLGGETRQGQVDIVASLGGFDGALVFFFGEHLADAQAPGGILPIRMRREELLQRLLVPPAPPRLQKFAAFLVIKAGEEFLVRSGFLKAFAGRLREPDHLKPGSHPRALLENGEHFGVIARLGEHATEKFLRIGVGTSLLDAEVSFHRLHPKTRRSLRIITQPEKSLIVGQSGANGI